jgi:hypothetical protein
VPEAPGVMMVMLVMVEKPLGTTGVPVATRIDVGTALLVAEVVIEVFMKLVVEVETVTMMVERLDSRLVALMTV